MTQQRLQHYLRTYRRRAGLSQDEVAGLLGASSGTKVSRYESFKRQPSVHAIFAFEIIFNQPIRELFAGSYNAVHRDVRARATQMLAKFPAEKRDPRTARKLQLLQAIADPKTNPVGRNEP